MSTYARVLAELESLGVMPERPPSLEPTRAAFAASGLLDRIDPSRVIVIAGTNGKGSTAASLEALLLSAGQRVGLYTSPHLVEITERIRIQGQDVSQAAFIEEYRWAEPLISRHKLTQFEATTLMAVHAFVEAQVDWIILEVGMGGLWDATNAVPHHRCVITTLAMDHEKLLGPTLVDIARNKFGIVGKGARVVHHPIPPEARALAAETASRTGSRWVERPAARLGVRSGEGDPIFELESPWGPARLALPGQRGADNAMLALKVFEELGFDPRAHLGALERVRWPGRMQRWHVPGSPCAVYLSGDHNPEGVRSLIELMQHYPRANTRWVIGIGAEKDADQVLELLARFPDSSLYLTETPFRGRRLADYGAWLSRAVFADASPARVLSRAVEDAGPEDRIVVTGSLYLVGQVSALK